MKFTGSFVSLYSIHLTIKRGISSGMTRLQLVHHAFQRFTFEIPFNQPLKTVWGWISANKIKRKFIINKWNGRFYHKHFENVTCFKWLFIVWKMWVLQYIDRTCVNKCDSISMLMSFIISVKKRKHWIEYSDLHSMRKKYSIEMCAIKR